MASTGCRKKTPKNEEKEIWKRKNDRTVKRIVSMRAGWLRTVIQLASCVPRPWSGADERKGKQVWPSDIGRVEDVEEKSTKEKEIWRKKKDLDKVFLSKKILFVILLLVTGISLRTRDFVIESRNHRVLIQTLDLSQSQSSLVNADELKTRQVGQWTSVIFSSSCSLAVFCFSVFQAQCVCRVCVCVNWHAASIRHIQGLSFWHTDYLVGC